MRINLREGDVGAFSIHGIADPLTGWQVHYSWWEVAQEHAEPQASVSMGLSAGDVVEDILNMVSDVWALAWISLAERAASVDVTRLAIPQDELPFP